MSTTTSGLSQLIEIDAGHYIHAVTFTANDEYLVCGGTEGVRVWRVTDGEQLATMPTKCDVRCLAASKDGRWIAAGSWSIRAGSQDELLVWDATTHEQVLVHNTSFIGDVDFSPDSTRLVVASYSGSAAVWDTTTQIQVRSLDHDKLVLAAKYSPAGDRIATATEDTVRVWDSDDGRLLVEVELGSITWHNTSLLWFSNHLFVKTDDDKIVEIDPSTGSTVSERSIPFGSKYTPRIALPQHGRFVAHSAKNTITLWDTSAPTQHTLIRHHCDVRSIAFSPDDQLLAIAGWDGKIAVKNLSRVIEPEILIDSAVLDLWKDGQLSDVEASLTADISTSKDTIPHVHVLASRALVRARLGQWDTAIDDAEQSIKIQPSVIGYIANCVALIGNGKVREGHRVCDIACDYSHIHATVLLLIKTVVLFLAGEHDDALSSIDNLTSTLPFNQTLYVVQAYMYLLLGNLQEGRADLEHAIQWYERARDMLGNRTDRPPLIITLISGWKFDDLAFTIQQCLCRALYAAGRTKEAGDSVLRIVAGDVDMTEPNKTWASEFMQRCLSTAVNNINTSGEVTRRSNAPDSEEASDLSHPMMPLLREWARVKLQTESWRDALATAANFVLPKSAVYQVIREQLEAMGRAEDAAACTDQASDELVQKTDDEEPKATQDLEPQNCGRAEDLGDAAMEAKEYDEASSQYTIALSLDPASPQDLLVKRSKAHVAKGEWEDALKDADEVIKLDPSSPWGYERKHEALRGAGNYGEAINAFETMLSKMSESSDPEIRERAHSYVKPDETKKIIRSAVQDAIRDTPLVLINTISGRLCNKWEQAAAFESTPAFTELVSSMTTDIDNTRIKQAVETFYCYAMLSHRWEENEPLFAEVVKIIVYDLDDLPTHKKLRMFCRIVRDTGFNWAWSDTCCIDKADHFVLQEALVSMFKWYKGSAMTIVFLLGVPRLAKRGALTKSIWNTRGWTLQEYHASKVIQFYTEDWTPYLGLDVYNHKESPEIILEMEEATGILAAALKLVRPGLDDIREKLRLASTRETTRVEDAAYSLLGIFSIPLPVTYGEGDKALGRLLGEVLTSCGDTTILAWTGKSNSFNTCLPTSVSAFKDSPTSHIPQDVSKDEMKKTIIGFRSINLPLLLRLYNQLQQLPLPSVSGRRIRLPCLTFKLGRPSLFSQNGSEFVFRAQANALGTVEIRTEEDLSQSDALYLVHPWIDFLLHRRPSRSAASTIEKTVDDRSFASSSDDAPLPPPTSMTPKERQLQSLQVVARLSQPFGALLLTRNQWNAKEYRRVATEKVIRVHIDKITSKLEVLVQGIQVLDVL